MSIPAPSPVADNEHRLAGLAVIGAASVSIAVAMAMIVAWLAGGHGLEKAFPGIFQTKFNTALCLAFAGAGLVCVELGKMREARIAAGLVLVFSVAPLAEYLTGWNSGFDQLLVRDSYYPGITLPGRMAANSALALTIAGTCLILATRAESGRARPIAVQEVLGFAVFALGAEGLIGYFQKLTYDYAWASYARMSVPAAVGLTCLGLGFLVLAWRRRDDRLERMPLWLPGLLCFVVLMVDVSTPLSLAVGIVYIPIIFCSLWFRRADIAFVLAMITSLLTLVGFFLSPAEPGILWIAIVNRGLTIAALWFVAVLVYLTRRSESALKRSDAALTDSEERYALAVRGLSIGIWDWNIRTGQLYWSPRYKTILGVPPDAPETKYGDFRTRLHPEDQARVLAQLEAHLAGKGPYDMECRLRHNDGHFVWIHVMGQVTWDDDKPARMVGSAEDISERKWAEEAKGRLASVVESSGDAIITKTLDGIITSWNGGAVRLFGYAEDEAVGRHINFLIPPDRQEEERHIIDEVRRGRRVDHFETVRLARNGHGVDISLTISPIRDAAGHVVGASKIARDISERREAELKLARYTHDLERSNQELDDFAYIASHDLKEPLRGLFNNARFLQEDYNAHLDDEGRRRLTRMGYLTQRMEQLVNDLLYFSRLGRQDLAIRATDLNAVVRQIETMMDVGEQNFVINLPEPLPTIVCDQPRITEVYRNLIVNGIKYNDRPEKIIEIGVMHDFVTNAGLEHQVFYVRDNGIGIETEFYEDIFRIFKRLNEEDDDRKGTGVGLTFVRKIIERHGGRIWLDSQPGQGTTFYFTIKQGGLKPEQGNIDAGTA